MSEIIKIVIKGASGYGPGDTAYNDKVTITPSSISYEYDPVMETEINPKRKWSYKTDSSIFKMKFETIAVLMPGVFERNRDEFCTDIGGIECVVVVIGNPLMSSPDFPPLHTVRESFPSSGVPSIFTYMN